MLSKSRIAYTRAKRTIPSGVNSPVRYFEPHPFFVKRSDKSHVWDADGKRYTDFCNGYGALLLGHNRKEIVNAVSRQLKRGALFCAPTEQETELSELIAECYKSISKVRLVNTGGEATMTAVRLARGFTGGKKIIKFDGGYHGAHDSMLVGAGSGAAHGRITISGGVTGEVARNTLVIPYNDSARLERTIQKNRDAAGVIIEPVLGNMGVIPPKDNFLGDVRRITKQNDVTLIFDEVITGFRASPGGMQGILGITPDITTLGKALGGGFAIAAVGGKGEIMDKLAPGGVVYQASTFAGNPVSVSAGIASINTINRIKNKMYPRLERYCARLAAAIDDIATDMKIPHRINFAASMFQLFFTGTPVTDARTARMADAKKFNILFRSLLKDGIFVAPSQFEAVMLSAAHTDSDISAALEAYRRALAAVKS